MWAPEALLRAFLDATVDALVRDGARRARAACAEAAAKTQAGRRRTRRGTSAGARLWKRSDSAFETGGFAERDLVDDLERWSEPALGARDRLRACFRLELPEADRDPFVLRFLLQSPDDPSLLVTAAEVWSDRGAASSKLGRAFRDPQESLLEALGRAARLFPPIGESAR